MMVSDNEDSDTVGTEEVRRATLLRPLVRKYLDGTGSLESGINDVVWEFGVSWATVWRWIRRLAEEGGRTSALVLRKCGRTVQRRLDAMDGVTSRIFALIKDLAIDAIVTAEECITDDAITK